MIDRDGIDGLAGDVGLRESIVEKGHVPGWLLAGIAASRVEPCSLRRTPDGSLVLRAVDAGTGGLRSCRVDRMQWARATGRTFTPGYAIELMPAGILPAARRSRATGGGCTLGWSALVRMAAFRRRPDTSAAAARQAERPCSRHVHDGPARTSSGPVPAAPPPGRNPKARPEAVECPG